MSFMSMIGLRQFTYSANQTMQDPLDNPVLVGGTPNSFLYFCPPNAIKKMNQERLPEELKALIERAGIKVADKCNVNALLGIYKNPIRMLVKLPATLGEHIDPIKQLMGSDRRQDRRSFIMFNGCGIFILTENGDDALITSPMEIRYSSEVEFVVHDRPGIEITVTVEDANWPDMDEFLRPYRPKEE